MNFRCFIQQKDHFGLKKKFNDLIAWDLRLFYDTEILLQSSKTALFTVAAKARFAEKNVVEDFE